MIRVFTLVFCAVMMQQASGVTYVRWGRTTCPSTATPLYVGYAANSHQNHLGSGSNYLCLHNNPKYGNVLEGDQEFGAFIYGVEYILVNGYSNNHPFSYDKIGGKDMSGNDAPCVVCYNSGSTEMIMVPGIPNCPSADMTLEYTGYLASEKYSYTYRAEFVCVDGTPEARPGGEATVGAGAFYPVQSSCGALPCPPYVEGYEVTCAVCTI